MRLTPAQIAVSLLCGRRLPPPGEARLPTNATLAQRIKHGRELLVQTAKVDFGYDLLAWHAHLKESRPGGYAWGRNIVLPRVMKEALDDADWQNAVRELRASDPP